MVDLVKVLQQSERSRQAEARRLREEQAEAERRACIKRSAHVRRLLQKNFILENVSDEELEEMAKFVAYGLGISHDESAVVGSMITSYSNFISTHNGRVNEQVKDKVLARLSKCTDHVWKNPANQVQIFPRWVKTGAQQPGRPTITYGLYNWVVDRIQGKNLELGLTQASRKVPLQVG